MLVVFLFSMAVFCAFADAYYNYGSFLRLDPAALTFSRRLSFAAYLLGPLIFGNLCDKKGPFGAGVFLALLAELSVLLAGNGHYSLLLFVMGSFIMQLCISGFFVLMPLLSAAFFGTSQFLRLYPAIAFSTGIFWAFAKYMYQHRWSASSNPGDFLLSLLFLIMISALFVYMAWKRRFVLVQPAQGHSKSV